MSMKDKNCCVELFSIRFLRWCSWLTNFALLQHLKIKEWHFLTKIGTFLRKTDLLRDSVFAFITNPFTSWYVLIFHRRIAKKVIFNIIKYIQVASTSRQFVSQTYLFERLKSIFQYVIFHYSHCAGRCSLTHCSPVLLIYIPWKKNQKIWRFSDVFWGYR